MIPRELSQQLAQRAEAVCRELLPNGKREGSEWVVGSVQGEAGKSLKVHLAGDKAGLWADFATDQTGADLLDLWCAVRSLRLPEAMQQARRFLGLPDADAGMLKPARKAYSRPQRPKCQALKGGEVYDYLISRGLTPETVAHYKLAARGREIVFPYLRGEELLNVKYLSLDRPNGKKQICTEKDAEPCLFGWQAVPGDAREVILTEGEIDALTVYQMTGVAALSVPFGGGGKGKQTWIENDFEHLERFDTLYLWFDADDVGRSAESEIIERLGQYRCRVVRVNHKDANAALQAGWTHEDFVNALRNAQTLDPEELKNASTFVDAVLGAFFPDPAQPKASGMATPWSKVGDNLRFRAGESSIWAGINGHGKSLLLGYVLAAGIAQGYRCCVASMEMPASATLQRLIRQVTGLAAPSEDYIRHSMHWLGGEGHNGGLWIFNVTGTAKAERLLEVMRYARQRYGIDHFVIDSLSKCGLAEDDYATQKLFVECLADFARDHRCHVHLVAHARKGLNEATPPGKMDVKGSGTLTDLVDNVLAVWRNKPKEEAIGEAENWNQEPDPEVVEKPDALLIVHKQRATGWEKSIGLWFDRESLQYRGAPREPRKRYVDYSGLSAGSVDRDPAGGSQDDEVF